MLLRFATPIAFAAATLGGAFFGFGPAGAAPDASLKISEPVLHENLAIYLVRGHSTPGAVPATLEEALLKKTIVVHETGNVSELQIENTGDEPVFIQFGDIVKGGRQDRVLTTSLLIPPNSGKVAIGAYCVEQGRWAKRGIEDVTRFSASTAQIFSREAKVAIARAPIAAEARRAASPPPDGARPALQPSDRAAVEQRTLNQTHRQSVDRGSPSSQGEIWRSVSTAQELLGEKLAAPVASEKSRTSLQLTLENERLKAAQQGFITALEPKGLESDDVVGVVLAVNGKIASADIYPSNGLFRKMWPKLIRAAATDAFAHRADAAPAAPSVELAETFLADAQKGEVRDRAIADIAQHQTRLSPNVVAVEARTAKGAWIHRNFLSAK
jgi:hypothetical protein